MTRGTPKAPRTPPPRPVRALVLAALALWLLSLALPALYFAESPEPERGGVVLVDGLMFGWATRGWAAYANPLFLVVALRLWLGGRPRWMTLAMLALVASLVLFHGQTPPEGGIFVQTLVAWGWGAVAWVAAHLVLATAAAVRETWLRDRAMRAALGGVALAVAAVGAVSLRQHLAASAHERASAQFAGVAVMPDGPCGLEYRWPESLAPLIPPGQTLWLDVDRETLALPDDEAMQDWHADGHDWHRLDDDGGIAMTLRQPPGPRRYALRLQPEADRTLHLRLLDDQCPTPLFDQPLRRIRLPGGGYRYCPLPRHGLDVPERMDKVYGPPSLLHTALRLAGQDSRDAPPRPQPSPDTLTTPCAIDPAPLDGIADLHAWDGREVRFGRNAASLPLAFCSADHAALVELRNAAITSDSAPRVEVTVQVHDRKDLRIQLRKTASRICQAPGCDRAAPDFVKGVRFDDRTITVATTAGDWTFPR